MGNVLQTPTYSSSLDKNVDLFFNLLEELMFSSSDILSRNDFEKFYETNKHLFVSNED